MAILFCCLSVVSALYSKQTSPPQILEANHKCTVLVKGSTAGAKKKSFDFQCNAFLKESTAEKHSLTHGRSTCARRIKKSTLGTNPSAVSRVLVLPPPSLCMKIIRRNQ